MGVYASLVLMAVADPPAEPSVPVVSNVLIGVDAPSRTRMKSKRSAEYTPVNYSEAAPASLSIYAMKILLPASPAPPVALSAVKLVLPMVNVALV